MPIWSSSLLALILTLGGIGLLLANGRRLPMDVPNERSLHDRPIPRIGGLVVIPAAAMAALVGGNSAATYGVGVLVALLFAVSAGDDRAGLPVVVRFGTHLVAAVGIVWLLEADWITGALAAVAIAWMTNLYNFMDGANGLAGGMAVFGFGTYAIAGQEPSIVLWSACLAAASAGFLVFNFDPARIFLGDAGSIPLGFLAGTLGYWGIRAGDWPIWFPVLAFAPFVVDASVTLVRRILSRELIWQAHRQHYYQRLVQMGWSHRRLAAAEYLLMATTCFIALLLVRQGELTRWFLAATTIAYAILLALVDRRWKRIRS